MDSEKRLSVRITEEEMLENLGNHVDQTGESTSNLVRRLLKDNFAIRKSSRQISSENENCFLDACHQYCDWTTRKKAKSSVNALKIDQRELMTILLNETVNVLGLIEEEEKDWHGIICIHKDADGFTGLVKTKKTA